MNVPQIGSWSDVEALLKTRPAGTLLSVPKPWVEHPRAHGMSVGFGLPLGQVADYFKRLDDGTSLQVAAFERHYVARLEVSPPRGSTTRNDTTLLRGIALGAILGASLGRSEQSLMTGAAFGGIVAALEGGSRSPSR